MQPCSERVQNLTESDVIVGNWGMSVLVGRRVWWFNLGRIQSKFW